jgi:cell division protease FtsH
MNRIFRNTIFYLLIFLVIIGVVSFFTGANPKTEQITYNTFISDLNNGNVTEMTVQPVRGVFEVRGKMKGYDEE